MPGHGGTRRSARDANSDFVQSLDRGLAVIRAFGPERERLSLSEVARATGLTRAAARRFLLTLVKLGYVRNDGREFSLRPRVLELGYAYLSGLALPEVAAPHLEELVARLHESSSISVLDGAPDRLCGPRAHQADHDGRDLRRDPVPGLRHVDGPGAPRRRCPTRISTATWPRRSSSGSPPAPSPTRPGCG